MNPERSWSGVTAPRTFPAPRERTTSMRNLSMARTAGLVAATGASVVLAGGVAYAFWSATGTGTAAASAGSVAAVNASVTTVASSATLLFPGVNNVPATINIHNPNTVGVKVTGFTFSAAAQPAGLSGAANVGSTCTVTNALVSATGATASGLSLSIAPGADLTINTGTGTIAMGANSDNGCQNATFAFNAVTVTAIVG